MPVIVELGAPIDSMASVLKTYGLNTYYATGTDALLLFRTRAVPAIVALSPDGRVKWSATPSSKQWPPEQTC